MLKRLLFAVELPGAALCLVNQTKVTYLRLVTAAGGERMPAERALAEDQIDVIRQWIEQGAKWPDSVGSDATEISRHWAYVSPSRRTPNGF